MIAEEVAKIYPELLQYMNGKPETVRYHLPSTMLLNEAQKQQRQIQSQQQQLQTQTKQNTDQAQQISSLETRLRRLEVAMIRRQKARRK